MERIIACIPPNPKRVEYIDLIHGPLYMGSHIHQHPPQSELPAQRCSRLDNKKANTPRSLNYRRSGVQDWTRRKYKGQIPPLRPQLATGYVETRAKLREGRGGQSLGEDVSKLGGSRDMEYPNIADGDSVAHEV